MQKQKLSWAYHATKTNGNTRFVAAVMAQLAGEQGIITASVGELMKITELSRNTVKRALRRLAEVGEIRCLITTSGERLGRIKRELVQHSDDGRAVYQLTREWSPARKAA